MEVLMLVIIGSAVSNINDIADFIANFYPEAERQRMTDNLIENRNNLYWGIGGAVLSVIVNTAKQSVYNAIPQPWLEKDIVTWGDYSLKLEDFFGSKTVLATSATFFAMASAAFFMRSTRFSDAHTAKAMSFSAGAIIIDLVMSHDDLEQLKINKIANSLAKHLTTEQIGKLYSTYSYDWDKLNKLATTLDKLNYAKMSFEEVVKLMNKYNFDMAKIDVLADVEEKFRHSNISFEEIVKLADKYKFDIAKFDILSEVEKKFRHSNISFEEIVKLADKYKFDIAKLDVLAVAEEKFRYSNIKLEGVIAFLEKYQFDVTKMEFLKNISQAFRYLYEDISSTEIGTLLELYGTDESKLLKFTQIAPKFANLLFQNKIRFNLVDIDKYFVDKVIALGENEKYTDLLLDYAFLKEFKTPSDIKQLDELNFKSGDKQQDIKYCQKTLLHSLINALPPAAKEFIEFASFYIPKAYSPNLGEKYRTGLEHLKIIKTLTGKTANLQEDLREYFITTRADEFGGADKYLQYIFATNAAFISESTQKFSDWLDEDIKNKHDEYHNLMKSIYARVNLGWEKESENNDVHTYPQFNFPLAEAVSFLAKFSNFSALPKLFPVLQKYTANSKIEDMIATYREALNFLKQQNILLNWYANSQEYYEEIFNSKFKKDTAQFEADKALDSTISSLKEANITENDILKNVYSMAKLQSIFTNRLEKELNNQLKDNATKQKLFFYAKMYDVVNNFILPNISEEGNFRKNLEYIKQKFNESITLELEQTELLTNHYLLSRHGAKSDFFNFFEQATKDHHLLPATAENLRHDKISSLLYNIKITVGEYSLVESILSKQMVDILLNADRSLIDAILTSRNILFNEVNGYTNKICLFKAESSFAAFSCALAEGIKYNLAYINGDGANLWLTSLEGLMGKKSGVEKHSDNELLKLLTTSSAKYHEAFSLLKELKTTLEYAEIEFPIEKFAIQNAKLTFHKLKNIDPDFSIEPWMEEYLGNQDVSPLVGM